MNNIFNKARLPYSNLFRQPTHLLIQNISRNLSFTSKKCTRFLKLQTIVYHGAARIQWVPCCNGARPPGAIEGGFDASSKSRLFIIRAHHKGGLYPGTLNMAKEKATIAVYGRECQLEIYEVLVAPYSSISWVRGPPIGEAWPQAIVGGVSDAGETLFIGRALHNGTWSVGKIHGTHGVCYIPCKGNVYGYKDFEILVQNQYEAVDISSVSECD
ncbi:unnamed protein product [Orchesella dallaii]|uniref:Uncharacterized protein n=1 Tax=Orchesella dallaii TaxID=48710 RepID=A0ABP1RBX1_9HEXA